MYKLMKKDFYSFKTCLLTVLHYSTSYFEVRFLLEQDFRFFKALTQFVFHWIKRTARGAPMCQPYDLNSDYLTVLFDPFYE